MPRLAEAQVHALAAPLRVRLVLQRQDAVVAQAVLGAPDDDVAVVYGQLRRRVRAPMPAEQEGRGRPQRHRDDGRAVVALVLVLVQTQPRARLVAAEQTGVGPEVVSALATGSLWTQAPETIRFDLVGALPSGSHPRDVGFVLAHGLSNGRWSADFDYRVIEFDGGGVEAFDLPARVALCNSVSELSIATVLFGGQGIDSDPDAPFQQRIEIDLNEIEPQIALPGGPEKAAPVSAAAGRAIQHASIGSCGSGMYEDFAAAAAVLRGKKIAEGVRMVVTPGSVVTAQRLADDGLARVFMEAGAMLLPAGCGPCAGGLMAPVGAGEVSVSTAAANHTGRLGAGEAYLASPLTVAASALAGRITDPRRKDV